MKERQSQSALLNIEPCSVSPLLEPSQSGANLPAVEDPPEPPRERRGATPQPTRWTGAATPVLTDGKAASSPSGLEDMMAEMNESAGVKPSS